MLRTASDLMQSGATPSVSEVAEAAGVSRATAYRYFPSQAALVQAVVDEALGPIRTHALADGESEARVVELLRVSMPRINEFESTFKAALKLALEQWARARMGEEPSEPIFTRGHRIGRLRDAVAPLRDAMGSDRTDRLAQALSLAFGVEALIVLKDIWGLDEVETQKVVEWTACALVRAATAEAA